MAKIEEVSSSNLSNFTLEELLDAFNEVMNVLEEVSFTYNVLKKKAKSLDNEVRILQEEKYSWISEKKDLVDENEILTKQNLDLKESLEKLVKRKRKLKIILGAQRNFGDKHRIGFDPCQDNENKTIFVKASYQKSNSKDHFCKPYFSKNRITCHYCGRYNHLINKCFIRNNPHRYKQFWVPKRVLYPNMNGPRKGWVPKKAT